MLKLQKYIRSFYFRDKNRIMNNFHGLKERQGLPLAELEKIQLSRLNSLLNHAAKNVPYYRGLFELNGLIQNGRIELRSLSELQRIPLLKKDIIRREKERLHSFDHDIRKSFPNSSGGSTGEPVSLLQDEEYVVSDSANLLLLKDWRGVAPFDSEIFIWGAERDTFEGKRSLSGRFGDFMRNRLILNSFRMTEYSKKRYIDILNRHRPKMIRAYADSIYEIARYASENNIKVRPQNVIHTGASNLHPFMREEIEKVFQCPVYDHYGGREVGSIASECSAHDGLHIMMEHNIVEVIGKDNRPGPPGHEGEIVVTNLSNYSMPIIRYRIGDMGIMKTYSPCPCGCSYPKMQSVMGRVVDVFRTADGQTVSPIYFIHLIGVVYNDGTIGKFQVIQKDLETIRIKLEGGCDINQSVMDNITGKIKLVMGEGCRVEFETVDKIKTAPSGKYRYTISELN